MDVHKNQSPPRRLEVCCCSTDLNQAPPRPVNRISSHDGNGQPQQGPAIRQGTMPYERPKRTGPGKIAIIGKAPSSMQLAPYNDESWEIWSINDSIYRQQVPRASRQFELHNIELTKQPGYDDY